MTARTWNDPPAWLRYALFQIPGIVLTCVALYAAVEWAGLPERIGWLLLGFWLVKDVAMYRAVRIAYLPPPPDGGEALVGSRGVAIGPLEPEGWVQVGAERWRARAADRGSLTPGETVRVRAADGFTLLVEADES